MNLNERELATSIDLFVSNLDALQTEALTDTLAKLYQHVMQSGIRHDQLEVASQQAIERVWQLSDLPE